MMNKRGMIGEVIGASIIIIISFVLFFEVTDMVNNLNLECQNGSTINDSNLDINCEMFNSSSTRAIFDMLPFIFVAGILFVLVPMIWKIFRGILYGIGEFFESFETSTDDKEEDIHLKKMKSRLKDELNSYNDSSQTMPTNKGVEWGSGVETGKGMDSYETKLKGGNDKKDG